jgi:hypothetical protein
MIHPRHCSRPRKSSAKNVLCETGRTAGGSVNFARVCSAACLFARDRQTARN